MADKKKKKQNPAMIIHMVISMIFGAFLGGYIAGKFLKPSDSSENQPDFLVGFIILLISIYALSFLFIIIHEAGHLVMGLLTGYKYLSFRVGSIVLQKTEQGMKFKKYSIAGTGGQCLMIPPDMENPEDVPYFWYNFGNLFCGFPLLFFQMWDKMSLSNGVESCVERFRPFCVS